MTPFYRSAILDTFLRFKRIRFSSAGTFSIVRLFPSTFFLHLFSFVWNFNDFEIVRWRTLDLYNFMWTIIFDFYTCIRWMRWKSFYFKKTSMQWQRTKVSMRLTFFLKTKESLLYVTGLASFWIVIQCFLNQ